MVPLGHLCNLFVNVGFTGSVFNLFVAGFEVAVADIFRDGAFENVVFLQNQPNFMAQGRGVVFV